MTCIDLTRKPSHGLGGITTLAFILAPFWVILAVVSGHWVFNLLACILAGLDFALMAAVVIHLSRTQPAPTGDPCNDR